MMTAIRANTQDFPPITSIMGMKYRNVAATLNMTTR